RNHRRALLARVIKDRVAADKQIPVRTDGEPGRLAIVDRVDRFYDPARSDPRDRSGDAGPVSRAVDFRERDIEPLGHGLPHRLLDAVCILMATRERSKGGFDRISERASRLVVGEYGGKR